MSSVVLQFNLSMLLKNMIWNVKLLAPDSINDDVVQAAHTNIYGPAKSMHSHAMTVRWLLLKSK